MTAGSNLEKRELGAFAQVDATDADDFIGRLDRMQIHDGFRVYKSLSFQAMQLSAGQKVADIGCGAGHDVARLAKLVGPEGHVTGIDLSQAMVDEAARRLGNSDTISFGCASVEKLPFADDSLDAIRADRVLVHVPNPGQACAEMLRVLKPGGRIVLCEPDMIGFWASSADTHISELLCGTIARTCANPYLARDMANLLRDLNVHGVDHAVYAMLLHEFAAVNQIVQFDVAIEGLKRAGLAQVDRLDLWWQEQTERADAGRCTFGFTMLMASGVKAPASSVFF